MPRKILAFASFATFHLSSCVYHRQLISETAINIGYSCKLLTDEMEEMFVVDGETYADVEGQLKKVCSDVYVREHAIVGN